MVVDSLGYPIHELTEDGRKSYENYLLNLSPWLKFRRILVRIFHLA